MGSFGSPFQISFRVMLTLVLCDVEDRAFILQYCEYHPNYEEAKKWMADNLTDDVKSMYLNEGPQFMLSHSYNHVRYIYSARSLHSA